MLYDWKDDTEISEVMKENGKRSQSVAKFIIVLDNCMNFTYFLKMLTSYIFDEVSDRKFLGRCKFPMDARKSPLYEVINIGQFIMASIHFNANALVDGFLAILVIINAIQNYTVFTQ